MLSLSATMTTITMKVEFDSEIRRLVVDAGIRIVPWLSSFLSVPLSHLEVFDHPSMQLDSIVCPSIRVGDLLHVIGHFQMPNASLPRLYARRIQPQCIDSCAWSSSIALCLRHESESMRLMLFRAVEMVSKLSDSLSESRLENFWRDQDPSSSNREHRDEIHQQVSSVYCRFRDVYEQIQSLVNDLGDISNRIERENQLQKRCVQPQETDAEILQSDQTKSLVQRVSDAKSLATMESLQTATPIDGDEHDIRVGHPLLGHDMNIEGGWDPQAASGNDLQASAGSSNGSFESMSAAGDDSFSLPSSMASECIHSSTRLKPELSFVMVPREPAEVQSMSDSIHSAIEEHGDKLDRLEKMGYTNRKLNASVLAIHHFNFDIAAEALSCFSRRSITRPRLGLSLGTN